MDLSLTPEETKFRDELRAWLQSNVPDMRFVENPY
jgi:hypothetical protein